MSWANVFAKRFHGLFTRNRLNRELDDEIRFHLEMQAEDYRREGKDQDEAHYAATRNFGGVETMKQQYREHSSFAPIERIVQDARYALRKMRKAPVFYLIVILTLAVGIGANTAIFTLLYGLVLRSLPVSQPSQLAQISLIVPTDKSINGITWGMYQEILRRQRSFVGMSAWGVDHVTAQDRDGTPRFYTTALVSGNGFQVLGVKPYLGRLLNAGDDVRGGPTHGWPIVLSYSFWSERFGRDPSVIGKPMRATDTFLTIAGVAPPDFTGVMPGLNPQVYLPFQIHSLLDKDSQDLDYGCNVIARLKPGTNLTQANTELKSYQNELFERFLPSRLTRGAAMRAMPARTGLTRYATQYAQPLFKVQALLGVVLLLCCANVGGLMMSKNLALRREFAIRTAMGGEPWRLMQQYLIESLIIATVGAAVGAVTAWFGSATILSFFVDPTLAAGREELNLHPDATAFFVAGGLAMCTTLLFGALPAWYAGKSDPGELLTSRTTATTQRNTAGRTLVPFQVALSLALVTVAGLLSQSLSRVRSDYAGFDTAHVTSQWAWLHQHLPQRGDALLDIYQKMVDRLEQLPGIQAASIAGNAPVTAEFVTSQFQPIGGSSSMEHAPLAFNFVGSGYFRTMQTRILAGREFEKRDRDLDVCIVNRSAAQHLFPHEQALGQFVKGFDVSLFPKGPCRIVGIAEDAKYADFRRPAPRTIYFPMNEKGIARFGNLRFLMRGVRQTDVVTAYRKAASEIMPTVPMGRFATLEQQIDEEFGSERLVKILCTFFGGLAVILSAIGLYGLLSSNVTHRTGEMGIRLALGASRPSVVRIILKEALLLFGAGLGLGGIVLYAMVKLVRNMLYQISAFDLATITGTVLLLAAVGFVAAYLPAHRASRVDPMLALRHE